MDTRPQSLIVFSRRDDLAALGQDGGKSPAQKEDELFRIVEEAKEKFEGRVRIQGSMWMDCTRCKTDQMDSFYAAFEDLVKKVMEEFQLVVPDTTVPDKIMKIATELFYERKSLETLICGMLKKNDQIVASTWIDALLQSQDFLSIPVKEGEAKKEYICTNLEKFGKNILSHLVEFSTQSTQWSPSDILAKYKSYDPERKWISSLPLILCALRLAFPNSSGSNSSYMIPCSISSHAEDRARCFWSPPPPSQQQPSLTTREGQLHLANRLPTQKVHEVAFGEGRRLQVFDERSMFHPAFLPQVVCQLLAVIPFERSASKPPIIWQGGAEFQSTNGCFVALYMHGAFVAEKMLRRKKDRKHGEPERLQTFDLLVKGGVEGAAAKIMHIVLQSVSSVAGEYWPSLKWSELILLPASVKGYFDITRKKHITTLPLIEPTSISSYMSWKDVYQAILQNGRWPDGDAAAPFTPFHLACHEGDLALIKTVCDKILSGATSDHLTFLVNTQACDSGMTPMMMAFQNGHEQVIGYLVANGCEIDFRKRYRETTCEKMIDENDVYLQTLISGMKRDPLETRTKWKVKFNLPGTVAHFFFHSISIFVCTLTHLFLRCSRGAHFTLYSKGARLFRPRNLFTSIHLGRVDSFSQVKERSS